MQLCVDELLLVEEVVEMCPEEIIKLAKRLSSRPMHEGNRRQISVPAEDWNALRDYLAQLEPIIQWPMPEREPATRLVVHGIPVVTG
jgi:hypothetical protein